MPRRAAADDAAATGGHYYDCVHGTLIIIIIAARGAKYMTIRSTLSECFARAGVQVAPGERIRCRALAYVNNQQAFTRARKHFALTKADRLGSSLVFYVFHPVFLPFSYLSYLTSLIMSVFAAVRLAELLQARSLSGSPFSSHAKFFRLALNQVAS